jgi:predicted Rdx family selenoprotein
VPGGKGDFIVRADGRLLWDKNGRDQGFPEHAMVLALLDRR